MPVVIINSESYDVYADVDDGDTYYNGSTDYAKWAALDSDSKARGLVTGTRDLDRKAWQGQKTDPDQELAFPREGLVDCAGNEVDPDTVPENIIEASILLALDYATGVTPAAGQAEDKAKRLKAGPVEIEYFAPADLADQPLFVPVVLDLVKCFLSTSQELQTGSIGYGADGQHFNDDFGFSGGI